MTSQCDLTQKQETTCLNCLAHGIFDNNNKLLTPCLNCAMDNNWIWNGKKCYGASEKIEFNDYDIVINAYYIFYVSRGFKVKDCLKKIPEECHQKFLEIVNFNS